MSNHSPTEISIAPIDNINLYVNQYFCYIFSELKEYAEAIKICQADNNTEQLKREFMGFKYILSKGLDASQNQVEEFSSTLENSIEQFYYNLIKFTVEKHGDTEFYQKLDGELGELSQRLQKGPYNFMPNGIERALRATFIFEYHFLCGQEFQGNEWGYINDSYHDQYYDSVGDIADEMTSHFQMLTEEIVRRHIFDSRLPFYALRLANEIRTEPKED